MEVAEVLQIIEEEMADTQSDIDRVTATGDEIMMAHFGGAKVALENLAARFEEEYNVVGFPS